MEPTEEQIKELMTTVACGVCGAHYQLGSVQVLGHRDSLWFLRVSCSRCDSDGLVAAVIKADEMAESEAQPAAPAEPVSARLDRAPAPGPITDDDVSGMHVFLQTFDGDFQRLFGDSSDTRPGQAAA